MSNQPLRDSQQEQQAGRFENKLNEWLAVDSFPLQPRKAEPFSCQHPFT